MRVRFWGTRGSVPRPGAKTLRYGGNTACVEVRSASGNLVVIDCGTGVYDLGESLAAEADGAINGSILISHTHWDHIQGFPFFKPLFISGNVWDIYAPRGLNQSLRETLTGQMEYTYFPITLEDLEAEVHYHDLVEGSFRIGDITIQTHYLHHPALTLGYRLQADGATVVYVSDSEPPSKIASLEGSELGQQDEEQLDFLRDADLVIHDAQYRASEYREKIGWGHSSALYAAELCHAAGAKRVALTHHDPNRDDDGIDLMVEEVRASLRRSKKTGINVFAAAEGNILDLGENSGKTPTVAAEARVGVDATATTALVDHSILMSVEDPETVGQIQGIAEAEQIDLIAAPDLAAVLELFRQRKPSILVIDGEFGNANINELFESLREVNRQAFREIPVIVFSAEECFHPSLREQVSDWLVRPVTNEYARTRVRTWILRSSRRWERAPKPDNEEQRLVSLCSLDLLDSDPEERFDRLTREASEAFDVPIALISLVDRDRQWFKSVAGIDATETPRDMAFCAHAILEDRLLVVPDTLLDRRFAENVLVTSGPRIRFYAGCPLRGPDGMMLGTLCIIDTRPRLLNEDQLDLLRNLGKKVESEIREAH